MTSSEPLDMLTMKLYEQIQLWNSNFPNIKLNELMVFQI